MCVCVCGVCVMCVCVVCVPCVCGLCVLVMCVWCVCMVCVCIWCVCGEIERHRTRVSDCVWCVCVCACVCVCEFCTASVLFCVCYVCACMPYCACHIEYQCVCESRHCVCFMGMLFMGMYVLWVCSVFNQSPQHLTRKIQRGQVIMNTSRTMSYFP